MNTISNDEYNFKFRSFVLILKMLIGYLIWNKFTSSHIKNVDRIFNMEQIYFAPFGERDTVDQL
jgi:hypothetical protein